VNSTLITANAARHAAAGPQLTAAQWGMLAFLLSEVALFSTLIVTYLTFMGQDRVGPTPREALSLPLALATTICLLSSSVTIHLACEKVGSTAFALWWSLTIALGIVFLVGTGYEWHELIEKHHLTINRNLFGTTYYTLVGFHALHVTIGVICMTGVLIFEKVYKFRALNHAPAKLVSWYWHFVDVVWIVVFTVVYLVSRSGV
jgi:cytochrome c oxidase subunit 3/cytochrome o ubiquinol oxidase subunit 3